MIKEHFAKVIRGLSVPPVMVSVLILILAFHRSDIFRDAAEIVIMMVLLGFVPVLAYVLSDLIPAVRAQGRDGQRKLAFVTNLVGYSCALLWVIITNADKELLLICFTYFLSVVFLTICNKGFHFRASGHASSFTGPLVFLIYFFGWKAMIPSLLVAVLIIWSSIYLKRHTAKELLGGVLVNVIAFAFSLIIISFA